MIGIVIKKRLNPRAEPTVEISISDTTWGLGVNESVMHANFGAPTSRVRDLENQKPDKNGHFFIEYLKRVACGLLKLGYNTQNHEYFLNTR